ncbi:MAG: cupin domain-containing protein, partial [Gaiellaceae bacterium]
AETGGEVLEYELEFVPGGFTARDHLHPQQEERHEVVDGSLRMTVAGAERQLGPGDVEVVPPATPHRLFPGEGQRIRARFALRPALETEALLETFFGLARDGKVGKRGEPNLFRLAVIFHEFGELGRPTRPSPGVQRAMLAPLAAVGRMPRLIEADVVGDLRGRGVWTLTPGERGTHVRFDWQVFADRPLLRYLTPVLRPLFRANHNWAIARAKEGLEPYCARAF